jgi:hypothetical protein
MKLCLKLLILFSIIACNQKNETSLNHYFNSQYSSEEKIIGECVDRIKKTCSGIDCYQEVEQRCLGMKKSDARAPASSMAKMQAQLMIEQNQWFFANPGMISNFVSFMRELKELKSSIPKAQQKLKEVLGEKLHGRGIGFYGAANFGLSKKWVGELVLHDKDLALFCAPSNGIVTDIGVEAGITALSTLGCDENDDYQGTFLTASFGVSTEAFLLPLGAGLSYSFGVDSVAFNNEVRRLKKDTKINLVDLIKEINLLSARLSYDYPLVFSLLKKTANFLFRSDLNKDENNPSNENRMREILKRSKSIGNVFKDFANAPEVKDELDKNGLVQLKALINLIDVSLTGCDSFSGGAGLSLSLSPVNVGFAQSYYTKAIEIDRSDYKAIASIGLLTLVNPLLMAPSSVPLVLKYARRVKDFRKLINNCATGDMKDFENFIYFN